MFSSSVRVQLLNARHSRPSPGVGPQGNQGNGKIGGVQVIQLSMKNPSDIPSI